MQIGELAKRTGCETETIRYYEREGLLPAPSRSSSGYRRYEQPHLEQLAFILHCRSLGMPLADIRLLAGFHQQPAAEPCDRVNALIDEQIQRVHSQIEALQRLEQQLLQLRSAELQNAVSLYTALGGGLVEKNDAPSGNAESEP